MKKLMSFLMLFMLMFNLVGCSEKNEGLPTETISKLDGLDVIHAVQKNRSEIQSSSFTMTMDFGVLTLGQTIHMSLKGKGYYDQTNSSYMEMKMSIFGFDFETNVYTILREDQAISYTQDSLTKQWTKMNLDSFVDDYDQLNNIPDFIRYIDESATVVKMGSESYNDRLLTQYDVSVKKESFLQMLQSTSALADMTMGTQLEVKDDLKLSLFIDEEYYYLYKVIIDLSEIVNEDLEDGSIQSITMTMTYDDFNQIDLIVVPEEVIKNAVEEATIYNLGE